MPDGNADYLCECSDVSCTEKIELALVEYEAVRMRPRALFIVSGLKSTASVVTKAQERRPGAVASGRKAPAFGRPGLSER